MKTVTRAGAKQMLNKVPEITLYFWIIKIMCTTVGETAADFLNMDLQFGLAATSVVTSVLLAVFLIMQLRSKRVCTVVILARGRADQYRGYADNGQSRG